MKKFIKLLLIALSFSTYAAPAANLPESTHTNISRSKEAQLFEAIGDGDSVRLRALIADEANINATDHFGKTSLHWASFCSNPECIRILLNAGANANSFDGMNLTPLHWASYSGHTECVEALLEGGATIDSLNQTNQTPLHLASSYGHVECVKKLIEKGANVNALDNDHITPLHMAVNSNNIECVKALASVPNINLNQLSATWHTPFSIAVEQGKTECMRELIGAGVDVNTTEDFDGATALHNAASFDYLSTRTSVLLELGANIHAVDNDNNTPLHIAACNGQVDVLKELLSHGADANARNNQGKTALHLAARNDKFLCLQALLEHDTNLGINAKDAKEETPLHTTAKHGSLQCLKKLINLNGIVIDVLNDNNNTPLYFAAYKGYAECVKILVEHGANATIRNNDNESAITIAATCNQTASLEELIIFNPEQCRQELATIDLNLPGYQGNTLMHIVVQNEHTRCLNMLLDLNANFMFKNAAGLNSIECAVQNFSTCSLETFINWCGYDRCKQLISSMDINYKNPENGIVLLHQAAYHGNIQTLSLLIELGADINTRDINGNTSAHYACSQGQFNCLKKIIEHPHFCASANNYQETPLHWIARFCHAFNGQSASYITLLVSKIKNRLNARDFNGYTPLHTAAYFGNSTHIVSLIENNTNLNAQNNAGDTPLHVAIQNGQIDFLIALCGFYPNLTIVNNNGNTALQEAITRNEIASLMILIDRGALDNVQLMIFEAENGDSALFIDGKQCATKRDQPAVFRFLQEFEKRGREALTTVEKTEDDTCYICLLDFSENTDCVTLPCGHDLHEECLEGLIAAKNAECPLCRTVIDRRGFSRTAFQKVENKVENAVSKSEGKEEETRKRDREDDSDSDNRKTKRAKIKNESTPTSSSSSSSLNQEFGVYHE
ncbi:ankyrin repeat domain-containing protein [bacterium]|nr:MAG: ankyrin repeat domain-containing protein [bacterium]